MEEPDLGMFAVEELRLVDRVIDDLRPLDATGASRLSHEKSAGWHAANLGETIPYGTAFISTDPIPAADIERALATSSRTGVTRAKQSPSCPSNTRCTIASLRFMSLASWRTGESSA